MILGEAKVGELKESKLVFLTIPVSEAENILGLDITMNTKSPRIFVRRRPETRKLMQDL